MSDTQLYDLFLSYKRKDSSQFVSSLAQALRSDGYQVWFDDFEIRPGDSLTASIERGLGNSLIIVAGARAGWRQCRRMCPW